MPTFGDNREYDKKCFTLYKVDKNKEKTIENLENVNKNDTKLVEQNKLPWMLVVQMVISGVKKCIILFNITLICWNGLKINS